MELFTIGVYGKTEDEFFGALKAARIEVLADIRRRRGVRGKAYAYANKKNLEAKLKQIGIECIHIKRLAPTQTLRQTQKQDDAAKKIAKSRRQTLSQDFRDGYIREQLAGYTWEDFVRDVGGENKRVALLCVEGPPEACHRSLIAPYFGLEAKHL
ncbi:MAG: DUF488 domain-containing protein [Bacteroidia bacterium]|nr:DUF488 domain-containing protein [Bacteroidia bacterium]